MGQSSLPVAKSMFKFAQHGKSGTWVSELLPHTAKIVDDITVIKTMYTDAINHDPAITFIQTGFQQPGRPSMGAWLSYGLGSENQNLPAFVVLLSQAQALTADQPLFSRLWAQRLPAVELPGRPLPRRRRPGAVSRRSARRDQGRRAATMLDAVGQLNKMKHRRVRRPGDRDAHRAVRDGVPHADLGAGADGSVEGAGLSRSSCTGRTSRKPGTYAANCLLARRLAERDVRFVQLYHRGWDQHGNLPRDIALQCKDTDQPTAALITDLKQRGLLDDTLVVWGGEFGRTVFSQGTLTDANYGRDHHPRNFCMWLAGGGIKRGIGDRRDRRLQLQRRRRPGVTSTTCTPRILHCWGSTTRS